MKLIPIKIKKYYKQYLLVNIFLLLLYMLSNDNKEKTYYMSKIPDIVNNNTYLKNEYDKQVGYFGKKWVENPYFSDKTKLDLIKHIKPEYAKEINLVEKSLPYIKKTQDFTNKYFSDNEPFLKENYRLYTDYVVGGKRRTKRETISKRRRNTHKKRKNYSSKIKVKQTHK